MLTAASGRRRPSAGRKGQHSLSLFRSPAPIGGHGTSSLWRLKRHPGPRHEESRLRMKPPTDGRKLNRGFIRKLLILAVSDLDCGHRIANISVLVAWKPSVVTSVGRFHAYAHAYTRYRPPQDGTRHSSSPWGLSLARPAPAVNECHVALVVASLTATNKKRERTGSFSIY